MWKGLSKLTQILKALLRQAVPTSSATLRGGLPVGEASFITTREESRRNS